MGKIQEKNMALLGTTTSGKPLYLPSDGDEGKLYEFIRKFPLDEQIDLFCISEALVLHYHEREIPASEQSLMAKTLSFFIAEMENQKFLAALRNRGLILSIDRANVGRELCLYL